MDARDIIVRGSAAEKPVTASVYVITVVMNEETPGLKGKAAKQILGDEFQRALDDGYFTDCRYDAITFHVSERVVIGISEQED